MCLRFAIAGTLATTIAAFSRKYFEEWFLRLKDKWTPSAGNFPTIESIPVMQPAVHSLQN
jgi:hypothetical protein